MPDNIITAPGFYQDYCDDKCQVYYVGFDFALGIDAGGNPARWNLKTGRHHNNAGYQIIALWVEPVVWEGWVHIYKNGGASAGNCKMDMDCASSLHIRYDSSKPKGQRLSEVGQPEGRKVWAIWNPETGRSLRLYPCDERHAGSDVVVVLDWPADAKWPWGE
jgi:hypothetical protein